MKISIRSLLFLSAISTAIYFLTTSMDTQQVAAQGEGEKPASSLSKAYFAGGCFWCIEADFEKLEGVIGAISGYTGGDAETANYKQVSYTETGHYEAIEVSYDPTEVSYAELVEYFWRHIDPTDPDGQFCDKGSSYRSAIFYSTEKEKLLIDQSLFELRRTKPFEQKIVTEVLAAKPFYRAEEYHQDYYRKNPIRYNYYRNGCGRDKRINSLWQQEKPD